LIIGNIFIVEIKAPKEQKKGGNSLFLIKKYQLERSKRYWKMKINTYKLKKIV
jgi:hypothetical protein